MAMSEAARRAYRPFRIATYVVYIIVATTLSLLFLGSVVRGLGSESPTAGHRSPPPRVRPGEPLDAEAHRRCLAELDAAHRGLVDRFYSIGALASERGSRGARSWQDFSKGWVAGHERIVDRCGLDAIAEGDARAEQLVTLADHLEDLHRIYSAHATRLLAEDGDSIQEIESALRAARAR